jgi:hypothetical protein
MKSTETKSKVRSQDAIVNLIADISHLEDITE